MSLIKFVNLTAAAVVMTVFSYIASLAIHNKTPAAHYVQNASPCNKRKTPKSKKKSKSMMSFVFI